jgi:DNA-binding MarR family transcriptional regulator
LPDQAVITVERLIESSPAVRAFALLLRAQAVTTRRLSASLQSDHGLTINDYEALLVLSAAPDQRLKRVELARRLLLTPSGVTRLLEGLERAGLVERTACDTDLRVAYAQLTDRGRETLADASRGHVSSIRELLGEYLSEDEIEQLGEILAKLPGVAYGDDACASIDE